MYTNWEPGEPNNNLNEDYVQLYSNGRWNDLNGTALYKSVIEMDSPVVDVCGAPTTQSGPVIGGTYTDCEGTITYTYTYTDCSGLTFDWVYTYTIEHVTPPSEMGGPVSTSAQYLVLTLQHHR